MEVVNTLDIDGTQWEIQDVVARNDILNLQNKNEEITVKINNVEETTFPNILERNINMSPNAMWVKISGLYGGDYYNTNVFIITARMGQMIQLICPIDDNNEKSKPVAIELWSGINKIDDIRFKDGDIYIHQLGWSALKINQISGDKVKVKIINKNPPEDAIKILINEFQLKR